MQIENLIADRHPDPPVHVVCETKAAKRQVLDRKVGRGIVRGFKPALQRRVVSFVDLHRLLGSKFFFSPCQQR